jgi:hypothetical protein
MLNAQQTVVDITTSALIVELNISKWTARKLDKGVSSEVVASKRAGSRDAGRFNKHLLAGRHELDDIAKLETAARAYLYKHTEAWGNNGQQILPGAKFMEFKQYMDDLQYEYENLVSSFITIYPTLITAQAMALGDMFNRNDFPLASELPSKFKFTVDYLPVPSVGDWRVQMEQDAQKELRAAYEEAHSARMEAVTRNLWNRLGEHLTRMVDRLEVDVEVGTPDGKPRKFHDTLVTSAIELCGLLKDLNITKDVDLEFARYRLEVALGNTQAETLRTDMQRRKELKEAVATILQTIKK